MTSTKTLLFSLPDVSCSALIVSVQLDYLWVRSYSEVEITSLLSGGSSLSSRPQAFLLCPRPGSPQLPLASPDTPPDSPAISSGCPQIAAVLLACNHRN